MHDFDLHASQDLLSSDHASLNDGHILSSDCSASVFYKPGLTVAPFTNMV